MRRVLVAAWLILVVGAVSGGGCQACRHKPETLLPSAPTVPPPTCSSDAECRTPKPAGALPACASDTASYCDLSMSTCHFVRAPGCGCYDTETAACAIGEEDCPQGERLCVPVGALWQFSPTCQRLPSCPTEGQQRDCTIAGAPAGCDAGKATYRAGAWGGCVASCASACGASGTASCPCGTVQCDGSCNGGAASGVGSHCGCDGVIQCNGVCSNPAPTDACGCGGTRQCDGSCSKPGPTQHCDCGGVPQCDGSCAPAAPPNLGKACGKCEGQTIQCDGSCGKADCPFQEECTVQGCTHYCEADCPNACRICETRHKPGPCSVCDQCGAHGCPMDN